ncbi:hypothetical protein ACFFJX_09825 [Pseudarcicella hirudinis]|uniref:hypothetical protein n=1 Tax=Pseudarcicella hirudinis TaxID=1079859 RepID=UPI0035EBE9EC
MKLPCRFFAFGIDDEKLGQKLALFIEMAEKNPRKLAKSSAIIFLNFWAFMKCLKSSVSFLSLRKRLPEKNRQKNRPSK